MADRRAAHARRAVGAGPRARPVLLIAGAAALLLIAALVLIFTSGPRPQATHPGPPTPGTQHPTPSSPVPPEPGTRNLEPSSPADRNAETVFHNAEAMATRPDWQAAKAYLDRLDTKYGQTPFYAAHKAEIDALRSKAESALKPPAAAWETAWKEAEAKAADLLKEERFADAIAAYTEAASRSEDARFADKVQKAIAAIVGQAKAAHEAADSKARQLLADKKFDEARAAIRPVVERHGVPGRKEKAQDLLAEIDKAEQAHKEATAKTTEDAATKAERERREAEAKARQQAEAAYAKALEPVEALAAAWDFSAALEALKSVPLPPGEGRVRAPGEAEAPVASLAREFSERLATLRDELDRLTKLKARFIAKINAATPRLDKRALLIPGINAPIEKADEKGITAKPAGANPEFTAWQDLTERCVDQLLRLCTDPKNPDDCLAAGILTLALNQPSAAEKHLDAAQKLGAAIDRYLDPLASAAFAQAKDLLDKKKFPEAAAKLTDIEKRYPKTPWLASHKADLAAAEKEATCGIAEAAARKLLVEARGHAQEGDPEKILAVIKALTDRYGDTEAFKTASNEIDQLRLKAAADSSAVAVWSMEGGNHLHTSRSRYRGPSKPQLKWNVEGAGYSAPAIGKDGTVYVTGGSQGRAMLSAFSTDGRLKWSFTLLQNNIPTGSPAVGADGTVYQGARDGRLYAVGPDRKLKWRFTLGEYFVSSPTIGPDGTIYAGCYENKLYAIGKDGQLLWVSEGAYQNPPAVGTDGSVYSGADRSLSALTGNGKVVWRLTGKQEPFSSPAIGADGTLYVTRGGSLAALAPNGKEIWAVRTGATMASPALGPDGTIYTGCEDCFLYAIARDGKQKWTFRAEKAIHGSPAIGADGTVYVGSDDGILYALGPDGKQKWTVKADGPITSSLAIAPGGTLYFTTYLSNGTGTLFALEDSPRRR